MDTDEHFHELYNVAYYSKIFETDPQKYYFKNI
jgi:hypothetical protein